MKLEVKENSKNYACSVVRIGQVFDIEGADNIKRVVVNGNNVVVSKDVKEGETMLYFVSGTQLNEEYCSKNNLYDKAEENYDKDKRGFISFRQRRVKALKLRGVISDGMLMPLTSLLPFLEPTSINSLKIGDEFTDINGNSLCEKYIVKIPQSQNSKVQKSVKINRLVDNQFYLHGDTDNFRKNAHKINENDVIGIHYKKHGTSAVIGNVLVNEPLTWKEKLAKFFGVKVNKKKYDIIYSSRKVIKNGYLNPTQGEGFYGEDIWGVVAAEVGPLIPKNWTLYGEILGYTPSGNPIQGKYDYGCKPGEHKFYVYKISVVNLDGEVIYLSDKQIDEYYEKVGLPFKDTLLFYGVAIDLFENIRHDVNDKVLGRYFNEDFVKCLESRFNEKDCYMCVNKVPEEGIIIRKESLYEYEAYKLKSKKFLLMESDEQEKEISNIEDEG